MTTTAPTTTMQTRASISAVERAIGRPFAVPAPVAHDALHRWYRNSRMSPSAALLEIERNYLGQHHDLESLAHSLAEKKHPKDMESWPWTSVDWSLAAIELIPDIEHGSLVEVGDHQWFIRAQDSSPRRSREG